jgi:hypothetical protein
MTHPDEQIEPAAADKLKGVMRALDEFVNEGVKGPGRQWGLVVFMFPYGAFDGRFNYISNGASRRDMVTLMKEMIARFEGQPELKGRA